MKKSDQYWHARIVGIAKEIHRLTLGWKEYGKKESSGMIIEVFVKEDSFISDIKCKELEFSDLEQGDEVVVRGYFENEKAIAKSIYIFRTDI